MRVLVYALFIVIAYTNISYAVLYDKEPPLTIMEKLYKKSVVHNGTSGSYLIMPKKIDFNTYTPSVKELLNEYNLKKLEKSPRVSNAVKLYEIPIKRVFFLPFEGYFPKWAKYPNLKIIIISDGTVTVDKLYRLIHNRKILSVDKNGIFTLKAPIYIGYKGGLIINSKTLHLALNPGAPIMCAGKLYILNSVVEAWDSYNNRFVPINISDSKDYYLYGTQPARPYITVIRGGYLKIISSSIRGLGYKSTFSTFGIGLNGWDIKRKAWFSSLLFLRVHPGDAEMSALKPKDLMLLFTKKKGPSCIIIGSNIEDNYMGFYSNNAGKVIAIGNIFKDNFLYNFDPHDWSQKMFVAYNIFEGARKAHGIVFSRYSRGVIMNNISVGNHGCGIMMDRRSKSLIKGNIVFGNGIGGITLLESDDNDIVNNFLLRNGAYGVYVRNSLDAQISGNRFLRNPGSGIEVSVINIGYQIYRNLYRDPYHESSSAWIEKNSFENDLKCEIKSYRGAMGIYKNNFKFGSYVMFGGDISMLTNRILSLQNKKPVIIPGLGNRKWIEKTIPNTLKSILNLELKVLKKKNNEAQFPIALAEFLIFKKKDSKRIGFDEDTLARCSLEWMLKSAAEGDAYSLRTLGFILYKLTKPNSELNREGLVLLSESAVLGDVNSVYILYLMPMIAGVNRNVLENSIKEALNRIEKGKLINCKIWNISRICCDRKVENTDIAARLSRFKKLVYLDKSGNYMEFFEKCARKLSDVAFVNQIAKIKSNIAFKNIKFKKFFSWEKKQLDKARKMYLEQSPDAIRFVNKELSIKKTWRAILNKNADSDFRIIKPVLEKRLKEINLFRDNKMKINIRTFLKSYKEKYFEAR